MSDILKPNRTKRNLKLKYNGTIISDPTAIACDFKTCWTEVAGDLASETPDSLFSPLSHFDGASNTFVYFETCSVETKNFVFSFKSKKSILSEVPSFAYNNVVYFVSLIYSLLFNDSVCLNCFPSYIKLDGMPKIHKSSNKFIKKNY